MNPPPNANVPMPPSTARAPLPSGGTKRTYPKPPPLWKRFAMLALKPEAWPTAAMYPLWVTLLPLALAILLAALAAGIATPVRLMRAMDSFDRVLRNGNVDLLLNSEGVLSTATPLAAPLSFNLGDQHILIDPSGATTLDTIKEDWVTLVTNQMVFNRDRGGDTEPVAIKDLAPLALPKKGQVAHINSEALKPFLVENRGALIFILAVLGFMGKLFTETLWVLAAMFMIFHTVRLGASLGNVRLAIPKRVACRIAAGVLVPVVLFSGLTNASGYSLTSLIGYRDSLIAWFFAAMVLALWAGHLTKRLFTRKPAGRRAT